MKRRIKKSLLLIFVCIGSLCSAQSLDDLNKKYLQKPVKQVDKKKKKKRQINNNFEYDFCDTDNDGFATIDLTQILNDVQVSVASSLSTNAPKLVIGTSSGTILEVNDLLLNPTTSVICSLNTVSLDVAINSDGEIFTIAGTIEQIDETNCAVNTILTAGGNSLSFDTQNNLYFNDFSQGNASVYRLDAGLTSVPYVWHDFIEGTPGGDFVILGNFMYIAWRKIDGTDTLFKVTVDSDINYVSHEEIGPLKPNTYGLASEQGVLYGVSTSELYRIDFTPDPTFETILVNNSANQWFGAAGFSEAVELVSSAHIDQSDAENNSDPLLNTWTNTVSGGQTIYIRTEAVATGDYVVTPVIININPTPFIASNPSNLEACDADDNGVEFFDLTTQSAEVLGTQDATLFEVVYSNASDFSTIIADPSNYETSQANETIYFRIVNRNSINCFSEGTFTISLIDFITCTQNNVAPEISVSGRLPYCPTTDIIIASNFTITDPDDTGIAEFFIQISSGYAINEDQLILTGNHPTITSSWDIQEGKLTLSPIGGTQILYTDLQDAVREVVYQSSNVNVAGEKFFSFNIGEANYLPSTGHFYEYVPQVGITWTAAENLAENRTYFGLQGYLATITSADEAQITGEQAAGAGWIGGSDLGAEGVWRWVTGPENGTIFWNGGVNGSSPSFAFWNTGEPNNLGEEHYAHVTDPSVGQPGSWNDLSNTGDSSGPYQPKGYVVEYGGMPGDPVLNISGSTSVYVPQIVTTFNGEICESGTTVLEAVPSEGDVLWYDALIDGNLLATGNTYITPTLTTSTTYYATVSVNGCLSVPRTPVEAIVNEIAIISNTEDDLICVGNSARLTAISSNGSVFWYTSLTSTTPIFVGNIYNTPPLISDTTYYVEADATGCSSGNRISVTATVDDVIPTFDLVDTATLCLDQGSLLLGVTNPAGIYSYEWTNPDGNIISTGQEANITSIGVYTVIATSNAGCVSELQSVTVIQSEMANFTNNNIIIVDRADNINRIVIRPIELGIGTYEYALDDPNGPYQASRRFEFLEAGLHTLYIRDLGGCGIVSFQFAILDYPLFFTPNGDGFNDTWQLKGIDASFYTSSEIQIFNRFGVLVANIDASSPGWNGISKGWLLPSNDYWFRIRLTDINGLTIEHKGHFSLLRR